MAEEAWHVNMYHNGKGQNYSYVMLSELDVVIPYLFYFECLQKVLSNQLVHRDSLL